ncbi:AAA family ATPase [Actinomyces wuliandei]|uniref:AAA family ATPase n=1 Tax=Actinomyces wuliandei TaxID=2057743 RepID=UPI00214B5AFB|nr:AAA family ATPase [Actinomyces wuliandei]
MRITQVSASNWRNFKSLDLRLDRRLFVVGPNAAGKSNLLDLFRFLGDIARPGGGLTSAISSRGGLSRVRSLFARSYPQRSAHCGRPPGGGWYHLALPAVHQGGVGGPQPSGRGRGARRA